MQQKAYDTMTPAEKDAFRRYNRLYPSDRPSYVGDILGAIEDINVKMTKIEVLLERILIREGSEK